MGFEGPATPPSQLGQRHFGTHKQKSMGGDGHGAGDRSLVSRAKGKLQEEEQRGGRVTSSAKHRCRGVEKAVDE